MTNVKVLQGFRDNKKVEEHWPTSETRKATNFQTLVNSNISLANTSVAEFSIEYGAAVAFELEVTRDFQGDRLELFIRGGSCRS